MECERVEDTGEPPCFSWELYRARGRNTLRRVSGPVRSNSGNSAAVVVHLTSNGNHPFKTIESFVRVGKAFVTSVWREAYTG